MARPYKTRRILPKVNVTEDSSAEFGMEDIEARLSETASTTDFSVYTENHASECSYVHIKHS